MDKAVLVVSYGTSYKETRDKTIGRIEEEIAAAFPDRAFYRAWTSTMIIKKIRERDGEEIDTPEEALSRMREDGVKDVLVQPTHLMLGYEYELLMKAVKAAEKDFDSIKAGTPVVSSDEDMEELARALMEDMDAGQGVAIVLMGHGSKIGSNDVYPGMQEAFRRQGFDNVFIGTVEAEPSLDDVKAELKEFFGDEAGGKVILAPLMVVAGNHATRDMTGDGDDTWEKVLAKEGYDVTPVVKGLGEYQGIRELYVDHAKDALAE